MLSFLSSLPLREVPDPLEVFYFLMHFYVNGALGNYRISEFLRQKFHILFCLFPFPVLGAISTLDIWYLERLALFYAFRTIGLKSHTRV